jgi:hypothetical protein
MPYQPDDIQSGVQSWDTVVNTNTAATKARYTGRYTAVSDAVEVDDSLVVMTGVTAGQILTLPAAASWLGVPIWISNESSQPWDIDPNGTETIAGGGAGTAITLAAGAKTLLVAGISGNIHRLV